MRRWVKEQRRSRTKLYRQAMAGRRVAKERYYSKRHQATLSNKRF